MMNTGKVLRLRIAYVAFSVIFVFSMLFVLEHIFRKIVFGGGQLMTPNAEVSYKTIDFDIVVRINESGIRGLTPSPNSKNDIYFVGDSFTFGFGISDGNTWVDHLNQECAAGINGNYRFINMGKPGTDTLDHVGLAVSLIKTSAPKAVFIQIYLEDDLQQVSERDLPKMNQTFSTKRIIAELFPATIGYLRNFGGSVRAVNATGGWAGDVVGMDLSRVRDASVRTLFEKGLLNPGLLYYSRINPERASKLYLDFLNAKSSESFIQLSRKLEELSEVSGNQGTHVVFVGLPGPQMVQSRASENFRNYGYDIHDTWQTSKLPDEVVEAFLKTRGFGYYSLVDVFRASEKDPFFEYDGHPNIVGQNIIAENICQVYKTAVLK